MRILFLSHYFPPEVNAPASRTYENCRFWARQKDVEVTVVTNYPNHPYGKLYPGYKNRWMTSEEVDGIGVIRVKTYLAANSGKIRRTLNYVFFMLASIIATLRLPKPDVVIATSPQFFCALAGFVASRIKRCSFVFELRDIWPASIVTVGAMRPNTVIRLLENLELFLYRKAARVVAVTDAFRENLIRRGICPDKIEVIKNGADLSLFTPYPAPQDLARELGAEGKFVVSYIGTIGMAHALDKVITLAESMRDNKEILFLIVGEGAEKRKIQELAARSGLENVRVLPGVAKKKVADYYALSDLNLVTLRKAPAFREVIPSKIFEIMAMARPILCAIDGECRQIIERAASGIAVEPENTAQMRRAILVLWENPEEVRRLGENGRHFVEQNFNRDDLAGKYLDLLKKLCLQHKTRVVYSSPTETRQANSSPAAQVSPFQTVLPREFAPLRSRENGRSTQISLNLPPLHPLDGKTRDDRIQDVDRNPGRNPISENTPGEVVCPD